MRVRTYSTILVFASILMTSSVAFSQTANTCSVSSTNHITVERFTSNCGASSVRDAVCYDGLGYPVQEISYAAAPSGKATVRPIAYDAMRRDDAVTYLPYAESLCDGRYVVNAVERQRSFYQSLHNDSYGYSEKEYEPSPVGRVTSTMNAGKEFRSSGKKCTLSYAANSAGDAVSRFTYTYPAEDISTGFAVSRGLYPANTLEKVVSTDEDGGRTETFTDISGKPVCVRQYLSGNDMLETRYIYDLKDSLVCVIQPEGVKRLGYTAEGTALNFADETMRSYCFLYRYDGLGRIIQSQVPGGGVSEFAYDERGRLVACSSPEMKRNGLWKVTGYDELDRVKDESYVKFQSGVSAESIRAEVSNGRDLPSHTTVRRTYSARYYGEREDGMPFDAYPVGDNIIFDVTDRISPASQSRMVLGETGENVLVSSAEHLYMPGETEINDVTAVPKEDFINDASGLSMSSYGERRFKTIQATEAALIFTADGMASAADRDEDYLKGLLKEERISSVPEIDGTVISADTLTRVRRYYYDYRGNVIQIKELDSDGWAACYSTKYDFAGNVTGTLESHTSPSGKTSTVKTVRTLTPRGVLLSETVYADDVQVSRTDYTYDDLLRPVGKTTGALKETMSYDIRGWQTVHTADRDRDRIYSETLSYMNPASAGSDARWTGLISESVTQHYGAQARSDSYVYDAAGRLTSSKLETGISYDSNGNVTALRRLSAAGATTADLTMAYAGNRLQTVTNKGTEDKGTFSYAYDSSGNLTSDTHNRLEIQNNVLNLPMRVEQSGTGTMGGTMTYTYMGDGTKAAARVGAAPSRYAGKRYRGSFVYDVSLAGVQRLESVAVSTGRLIALTGTNGAVSFESDGFITDHLGNVAAIVNLSASPAAGTQNAILEQNDYTPFGTKLQNASLKTQVANRWRYAGKEEQDIAGMDLRLLDFGARYYDSFTCRWNAVDPLAHKYFSMSPYNYCGNDPVNYYDAQGDSLIVKDMATLEAIYNGIQPGTNVTLFFNNGVLDPSSIPDNSGDFFLDDLKEIACDKRMVEMETSPSYSCILVSTGERDFREFGTPKDRDDNDVPDYVAFCKEYGEPYGKHIVGDLGRSLFPASTESISVDGKIHVIINSKGTLKQRTVGSAHEFAHVLLYFRGLPYQHWQTVESDAFIYNKASEMSKRLGYDY